jgi:hypothetical protein
MPLYWLVYRHHNQISVVIEPGASIIHARLRVALDGLDEGEFTEGHELPGKWKVAKQMIGRRLSQEEAKRLLAKLEWGQSLRLGAAPPSRVISVSLLIEHDGLIRFEERPVDHRLRQSVPLQCLIIERHQHFELCERCLPKVLV